MSNLSPELYYTALTAGLTAVLWVPVVLERIGHIGLMGAMKNPARDYAPRAEWAFRLAAAHRNAVENLAVFAALALVVQIAGVGNALTAAACMVFFWARLVHVVVYALGLPVLRTLAFAAGFACQAVLFLHLLGIV